MKRTTPKAAQKVITLTQQQADFTAEGSPPPGRVATSVPVATHKTTKATSPATLRGARKSPSSGRGR
jgi:hypothetical protein